MTGIFFTPLLCSSQFSSLPSYGGYVLDIENESFIDKLMLYIDEGKKIIKKLKILMK